MGVKSVSDYEIARNAEMLPVDKIAAKIGISGKDLFYYGPYMAKIKEPFVSEDDLKGRLILVSAITPTPAGEGKTTTTIGLGQGLQKIGKNVAISIREPSLGPVMGMKGGGAGGGMSQVLPMEEINLHFTGDIHAVGSAHNFLASIIDNHMHFDTEWALDERRVLWRRVVDMNDRALRQTVIGLGGKLMGVPRETGWDITAASEIMAILCLSKNWKDLRERLSRIVVGFTHDNKPVTPADIKAVDAMMILLKYAFLPNIVQTMEGVPAFVHGGPFANIAHGTSSAVAARFALSKADYVITEAGFGFDLGAEKFMDIFVPTAGIKPALAVIVATARALKMHGDVDKADLDKPNMEALRHGFENLDKHIENKSRFNLCSVVAINRHSNDTDEEIQAIVDHCNEQGVAVAVANGYFEGGDGMVQLAKTVVQVAETCKNEPRQIYDWNESIEEKIKKLSTIVYGAENIDILKKAEKDIKTIKKLGLEKLPICMAKTQNSLSDNPDLLGRPKDFLITVREVQLAAGAGFVIPITGDIMRMPGLPKVPNSENFKMDDDGKVISMF
ncbi:MAG: formate--tetrahydrofolate ligase [Acidobacteria bacterium]|nr:formate--tetrahydrofolate ligase [Acidobacteriota bacterium]